MNFNLDLTRMFKLLKVNFRGILKYTSAVLSCMIFFTIMIVADMFLYKKQFFHISYSVIIGVILLLLFIVLALYFSGLNCEICHNLIEEKDEFMPKVKGRFLEFLSKGVKLIPGVIVFLIVETLVFLFDAFVLIYLPNGLNKYLDVLVYAVSLIFFVPFFMAYTYTFKPKSFFSLDNFKIFGYAYPEFMYSNVISRFFAFLTTILFCLMFAFALIIMLAFLFGISLFKAPVLTGSFASILLGIIIVFGIFFAFLMNNIVVFYMYSLNAQSYNYGKYFLCKGEAPKRPLFEKLLPIALIAILCYFNIVIQDFNDDIKAYMQQNKGTVSEFVQKISK